MHPRLSRAAALLLLLLVLGLSPSLGRVLAQTPAHAFNPTDVIPFDAAVHTAPLPNGLKYFVRRNDQPAKRIALRLAAEWGSVHATDDHQEVPHFIPPTDRHVRAHFHTAASVTYI